MSDYKIILQKDIPERTHISGSRKSRLSATKSLADICDVFEFEPDDVIKPIGFWYSLKWYWIEELMRGYYYDEIDYTIDPNREYYVKSTTFVYDVDIDKNTFVNLDDKKGLDKILQLNTPSEMSAFFKEYGFDLGEDYVDEYIDWKKVYMDYGGIELAAGPLWDIRSKDINHGPEWFTRAWDISSGCVWNDELVKLKWIG